MPEQTFILPALVLIPLIGGLLLTCVRDDRTVRSLALLISLVVFALSLVPAAGMFFAGAESAAIFDWNQGGTYQLGWSAPWVESLGIHFAFGVNSISLSLLMLTTFLMPLTILGSFSAVEKRHNEFYLWLLVLQAAMIGVFIARDLVFFYVCFELTLIPMFFLIGIFGGAQKRWAAHKFFIFTLCGSVFTLAGVLYVAWVARMSLGAWTFDIGELSTVAMEMSRVEQGWVLGALLAGFAVKVPLFPVHTWLPLAHTEAPTAGSVILAGVLLKLGSYGLLLFAPLFAPVASIEYAPLIAIFCIIGIIYAALICWVQDDVKKLVAYSSVSHMGFCILGLFAFNVEGISGSVMYMINHGLSTGALFLCIGMIYERYHTRDMNELSGLGRKMPIWATFMVFFSMASVGLPGLNGFVGEFLTVLGAFRSDVLGIGYAAAAGFGMILAAIYILYMVGKICVGPVKEPEKYAGKVADLTGREITVLAPLAVVCLVLGLYPTPLLRSYEAPIGLITQHMSEAMDKPIIVETDEVDEPRPSVRLLGPREDGLDPLDPLVLLSDLEVTR